jgi:hypothetical protein
MGKMKEPWCYVVRGWHDGGDPVERPTTVSKVVLYIARAIQAFVKYGKTLIKISYFLSKFDLLSVYQFH